MTFQQRLRLDAAIRAVCPIHGTSGDPPRIDFRDEATSAQRIAAQFVVDNFDRSDAAQIAWEDSQHPERNTIRQAAAGAVTDNDTYLALTSPTNAQVAAQVRRLTQQNNRIISRLIQVD